MNATTEQHSMHQERLRQALLEAVERLHTSLHDELDRPWCRGGDCSLYERACNKVKHMLSRLG